MTWLAMVIAVMLKLGSILHFVSNAVMVLHVSRRPVWL